MSRPLRIDIVDGWYHAMSRGLERRELFTDDRDRSHFVGLLEECVGRHGVRLHAYVLMSNHYHLLVQTPNANLSRAVQWLNVAYVVWFNRRHGRVGPLMQGRFKAVPVDGAGAWALDLSAYLHLNPVRVASLGLGKRERRAGNLGVAADPEPEVVKARIACLRRHRWSSYPAYAGRAKRPDWLTCEELWRRARRGDEAPERSYRRLVEGRLGGGFRDVEAFGERLKGLLAVGPESFMERLRGLARGDRRTQPALRRWRRLMPFERVAGAVAATKGEPWDAFRDRHGDDGRDMALWLGRRHCGLTLGELGVAVGNASAAAVGSAVRRMDRLRLANAGIRRRLAEAEAHLTDNET
jgi:REP element-mobilizing transposase RayT